MNRRGFLRAVAASAVIAAIPASVVSALPTPTDRERLESLIRSGRVVNESFVLTDGMPVVIPSGTRNLLMSACTFVWLGKKPSACLYIAGAAEGCVFTNCFFDAREAIA